jgi:thiamine biosynthesis lipoprotein ApbE
VIGEGSAEGSRSGTPEATRATEATVSIGWRALGTGVRLVVNAADPEPARRAVVAVLEQVDGAYSRFRDDSEIVAANRRAGRVVTVSPLLGDAIAAALRAAELTAGAVDPTVGRAMRAIGYDADFDLVRNPAGPIEIRLERVPGWRTVALSASRREVLTRPRVELDLGSTGKGLAADLAAAAAFEAIGGSASRGGVLVSLGGDIAVLGNPPTGGWRILMAEDSDTPTRTETGTKAGTEATANPGEVVAIETGALATSSTTVRRWQRGSRTFHHIVDPRTGDSVVSPWRTASVVAATAVDANTAATAAIVLGVGAVPWLRAAGLPARLVSSSGDIVRLGGWPEPDAPAAPATSMSRGGSPSPDRKVAFS